MPLFVGLTFVLATSCVKASESDDWRDFEVFQEESTLDSVDFDYTFEDESTLSETAAVDRDRTGLRMAWGGETSRGYVQIFTEDWSVANSTSGDFEGGGTGGGAMGTPEIGDGPADTIMVLPWRVDLSLGLGSNALEDVAFDAMYYTELHADLGVGLQWNGLQPSIGIAYSQLTGFIESNVKEGDPQDEVGKIDLAGSNFGFFLDVKYRPEDWALYAHFRALSGDYEATTFGIGVKF